MIRILSPEWTLIRRHRDKERDTERLFADHITGTCVYRFWSPVYSRHFYTSNIAEKQKLIDNYAHVWTYEGVAYHAAATADEAGLVPVHRFWSDALSGHFYTTDTNEKDKLVNTYSHVSVSYTHLTLPTN